MSTNWPNENELTWVRFDWEPDNACSYNNGPEQQGAGYVNPLYKTQINVSLREPLPEQGDIGVNLVLILWSSPQFMGRRNN